MIDIKLIREKPLEIKEALLKKMDHVDFSHLLELDKQRRELTHEKNQLREQQNKSSSQIPVLKKQGKDTEVDELKAQLKVISDTIQKIEREIEQKEQLINEFLEVLPNPPAADVQPGGKESNQIIRTFRSKPEFDFKIKDHVELVESLNLIDYGRGVKLGGNGFWLYTGDGALLEWSLLNFFIQKHTQNGYTLILPPHLLLYECGYTAGQFPKFKEDVFHIQGEGNDHKKQFLLPTAETAMVNILRDELIHEDQLPKKYCAYSPCYRREAGSYRTAERGMIRGHQFNKVELFQYTRPEDSAQAHEDMVRDAESILQDIGLHYQVSKLAARDCSDAMAKTYDIEVWLPSIREYKEVSSASNAHEYQARRGNMRFRRKGSNHIDYMHTLNASGLATSRLIPAIVEQFQKPDGTVAVPEVLQKWVGKETLTP